MIKYINDYNCTQVDHGDYERTPDVDAIDIDPGKGVVQFKLQKKFEKSILSINHTSLEPDFDPRNCGFNLNFSDPSTGNSFTVTMQSDGTDSGVFAADKKDIETAMAAGGMSAKDNRWIKYSVAVENISGVNCESDDNTSQPIRTKNEYSKFTISDTGNLTVKDIKLVGTLDSLLVFISKNIGSVSDNDGNMIPGDDFPFDQKLKLQDFYIERAITALQKYGRLGDIKFKNMRIFEANNGSYTERLNVPLPNKNLIIDPAILVYNHDNPVKDIMPSVSRSVKNLNMPISTGQLVIGSFGLPKSNLCDAIEYRKILKYQDQGAISIINFVPIKNVADKNYTEVLEFPSTRTCPDNQKIQLVFPSKAGQSAPDDILDGLYTLISRGLDQ